MITSTSSLCFCTPGCLYRGWYVRFARTARPRDSGRFRDGCRKGDAKGFREEHVHQKALEVIVFLWSSNPTVLGTAETSSHSLNKQSTKNQKSRKLTIIRIHWEKKYGCNPKAFSFSFHKTKYSGLAPRLKLLSLKPSPRVITYFLLLCWLSDILDEISDVPMDFPNARYANTKRSECAKKKVTFQTKGCIQSILVSCVCD